MADYVCKDPTCTGDVAWHLIHGDLDCIGDNKAAVAEFASAKSAPLEVTVLVTASGYVNHTNVIVLQPVGAEEHTSEPMPEMEM